MLSCQMEIKVIDPKVQKGGRGVAEESLVEMKRNWKAEDDDQIVMVGVSKEVGLQFEWTAL